MPYPYIIEYVFPHYQIYISDSPNPCIHFIEYIFNHHQTRAFISSNTYIHFTAHAFPFPLRVCLRICGHDKSDPYSCERIAIMLLTDCDNAADGLQQRCEQIAIYPRTPTKHHTFALQIPYFCTTKTILSHRKTHTFAPQKPIGDKLGGSQKRFVKIIIVAETNISHTQNKTLSSLLEYHFLNHYNRLYRVRITI